MLKDAFVCILCAVPALNLTNKTHSPENLTADSLRHDNELPYLFNRFCEKKLIHNKIISHILTGLFMDYVHDFHFHYFCPLVAGRPPGITIIAQPTNRSSTGSV